jgi:asparagine synthase (glutamine-hydrolysing)
MCGIVGIFDRTGKTPVREDLLERMNDCLVHRGPDDSGYFRQGDLAFGFRRLSIIDPAGGNQPMFNEDETLALVCNGEIYNYKELRASLVKKGHRFRSACDVEVILHLFEEEGPAFIRRLNGQFAFALFDQRRQTLLIARDHAGIVPLFYTQAGGHFIFSSEIKAILRHPAVRREVNLGCLDQIISFPGYVSPNTMFRDIHSLKPGHFLQVDRQEVTLREYWDLNFTDGRGRYDDHSEDDYLDRLEEILLQSVRYRLNADVPVGFYLSGGLDSSLIGAMIHKVGGSPRKSFSIVFGEKDIDERNFQRQVCAHLKQEASHHEIHFRPVDIADRLRQAVYFAECPLKESYNTCSLALSEEVRKSNIKVVLTGEGADELFAGYVGYRFDLIRPEDQGNPDTEAYLEEELRNRMWGDPHFIYEKNYYAFRELKRSIYSDSVNESFHQFDCFRDDLVDKSKLTGRDHLQRRSYIDFKLRLGDHLVADHGDRVAYANSVEARYPFLDIELIEFATALPSRLKLNDLSEKYLLRRCGERYLPPAIVHREKFGFVAPGSHYLLKQNIGWVNELLSSDLIRRQGYFNPETVERLKKLYGKEGFQLHQVFETDLLMVILTFGLLLEIFDLPSF